MPVSRLSLAQDAGLFEWPRGPVVIFGAGGEPDPGLPEDGLTTYVETIRPAWESARAAGYEAVTEPPAQAALAVVFVPRSKDLARARIAEATEISEGPVVVDGLKSDGIESLLRDLRKRCDLSEAIAKHHGKIAVIAPGAKLSDWADPGPREIEGGFVTRIGLFSADGPDPGSRLLAEALPARPGARVADLGAGWGFLSRAVLERDGVEEVHLIEADRRALDCARRNIADPRAHFHWADATRPGDLGEFDTVVTNPPFHQGRSATPSLGAAFIRAAAELLGRRGQLWLVANRHLPYEKALAARFGEVAEIGGDRSYKLFRAARPRHSGA